MSAQKATRPFLFLLRRLSDFTHDRRGSVLPVFGFALLALMGVAGLAIDMSYLYTLRTQLQTAADAAAFAAASKLPDANAAEAEAIAYATKNLPVEVHGTTLTNSDVVVGNWDGLSRTFTPNDTPINAVQVSVRRSQSNGNPATLFISQIFGFDDVDVSVSAMTTASPGRPGCILALDDGDTADALEFTSINSAELYECVPAANSTHNDAIKLSSMDFFHAGSLYSGGGIDSGSIDTLSLDNPAETHQDPLGDPYADLSTPVAGPCDHTNFSGGGTLTPGVYCGGMTISGATLEAGTYYIVDGDLNASGGNISCNCSAPGSGVTFVLTGTTPTDIGVINIGNINSVSLRAPSDASYDFPGMLVYVDRDSPYQESSFSSIDSLTFNGAIYMPSQKLTFGSIDWSGQTDCSVIVALRLKFNSIDNFGRSNNCTTYGTDRFGIGSSKPSLIG